MAVSKGTHKTTCVLAPGFLAGNIYETYFSYARDVGAHLMSANTV